MPYFFLVLAAGAFGAFGYWRGGLRLGLTLTPLILASLLLWLFGRLLYRFEVFTGGGLIWPALILLLVGVAGGYAIQFFARKKLPKQPPRADRIVGSVVGVFLAIVLVWLSCVYIAVRSASEGYAVETSSSARAAKTLNTGMVRWVPGLGGMGDMLTMLMELSAADDPTKQRAVEELRLHDLLDIEPMERFLNDASSIDDIEAATHGSLAAIWRLQKNPLLLDVARSPEMQEALKHLSLADVAEAVRRAQKTQR
jgi:hypothetical protein